MFSYTSNIWVQWGAIWLLSHHHFLSHHIKTANNHNKIFCRCHISLMRIDSDAIVVKLKIYIASCRHFCLHFLTVWKKLWSSINDDDIELVNRKSKRVSINCKKVKNVWTKTSSLAHWYICVKKWIWQQQPSSSTACIPWHPRLCVITVTIIYECELLSFGYELRLFINFGRLSMKETERKRGKSEDWLVYMYSWAS